VANQEDLGDADAHEEIVRLEEHIEELAAKIDSCRKFILAARIAVAAAGVVLAAMLASLIRPDLGLMAAAVSLLLGGLLYGVQTVALQKEATMELAAAETDRAAPIEQINPCVIS
jgi:hypothetical protein